MLTLTLSLAIVLGGMSTAHGLSGLGAAAIGGLIVAINVLLVLGMLVLSYKHARQGVQKIWVKHSVALVDKVKGVRDWLKSRLVPRLTNKNEIQVN